MKYGIKEAKNELFKKQSQLELYLNKKKIEFEKTSLKSIHYKDFITSFSGGQVFDKFTHYLIKSEKYDNLIYQLSEEINAIEKYIISEIERMSKYDEISLIEYLRFEEKMSWKEIDKSLHYGEDYSRLKYNRYKKCK